MAENGILDYQGMNQAIYRGATSNIVVDTQSMSIEIGAGNVSHTSNLHFECNHDANVASIKLNSNVTTEFTRSKKLIKYPRVALTQNDESATSGYVASANSEYHNDYAAFRAFNTKGPGYNHGATIGWEAANISTFNSSGAWVGSTSSSANTTMTLEDGNTIYGEWLQIQLPTKIRLEYVNFLILSGSAHAMAHRGPRAGYILGSNNGTNWTALKNWSGIHYETWVAHYDKFYKFDINREVDNYQYFRFVWTETASDTGNSLSEYASCQELEFWGVPEYDPEVHGTDVTIKSKANVPNTDWLEVYFDAKDLGNGIITAVDDLTPGGTKDGTAIGDLTVSGGVFTFDGTNDLITSTTLSSHFTGDPTVTYACWVKFSAMTTNQMFFTVNAPGVYQTGAIGGLFLGNDGTLYNTVGSRGIRALEKLVTNRWYHLVGTKIPGNTGLDTQKLYIDGIQAAAVPWNASGNQVIGTNPVMRIGGAGNGTSDKLNGSMANARLFNRVLSTDEIYQLYDYQKEYFGHSTNNMTLKAGRLGIGTSEPRAVLDVRGGGRFKHMNDSGDSDLLDVHGAIRVTGENPDYLRIRLGNHFSVGEATGVAVPETLTSGRPLTDHPRSGSAIIEYTGGESYTRNEGAHIWLNGDTIGIMNTGDVGTLHWYDSDMPSAHTTSGRHWQISTSGGIANTSDLTLKNNIRYFDDEYNTSDSMLKYSQIKFCKYNWKKELKDPSRVKEDFYGVIAQEIEPLFPEMIQADEAGLKMLKQERLQYISYHMIAKLIQKNADLEARISALENA